MTEALGTTVERSTEYTYDTFGQMLTKTQVGDAVTETAITQYFFDAFGNVSKVIDAELNEMQYTSYDSQGNNLIMTDGRGNSWTYGYDNHGNMISDKNPLNEETTHTFNKVSNLIKIIYPDNNFIQLEYDNQNRVIKSIDELGYFSIVTFDQAGNIVKTTNKNGKSIENKYDLINRITESSDEHENITKYIYPNNNSIDANLHIAQPIKTIYPTYELEFKYDLRGRTIEEKTKYSFNSPLCHHTCRLKISKSLF